MNDLFETKEIKPMLIGAEGEPFDSPDFIYELKLDGERCIAYLDPQAGTELRNKRNMRMLPKVPELAEIHRQVRRKCILDGELIVLVDGKPNFFEIQKRSLTSNEFKIKMQSEKLPASFVAFDIIYDTDRQITDRPLLERKKQLNEVVIENDRLAVSRYLETGVDFFSITKQQGLEGIVAKRKDSKYYFDKRTRDWTKIKNLQDDDFVVCGYIEKENNVISVVLGQYNGNQLVYKGHVTLGVSSDDYRTMVGTKRSDVAPFAELPSGNEAAMWLKPQLVCTVKYMMLTKSGGMRQPVFKGLREDKAPSDCIEHA